MTREDKIALRQAATVIKNEATNLAKRIAKFNILNGTAIALVAAKALLQQAASSTELKAARDEIAKLKADRKVLYDIISAS